MNTVQPHTHIIATQIQEQDRLNFLPHHFCRYMLRFEQQVYRQLDELAADYHGGYWEFYDLSNGGCYLAPTGKPLQLTQASNGFEATVSADAAGIIATLYALSSLAFQLHEQTDVFTKHYHRLREYALEHAEAAQILAAID